MPLYPMIVIRERIVGNISRLAISTAKREVNTRIYKLKEFPVEAISDDAVEKIAIAYLNDAIEQVRKRKPRL